MVQDATVFSDVAVDELTGSSGRGGFVASAGDVITGLQDGEDVG
jgi:hypothetical protein